MLSRFECESHGVLPRTVVFLPHQTGVHLWDIAPIFAAIHPKKRGVAKRILYYKNILLFNHFLMSCLSPYSF